MVTLKRNKRELYLCSQDVENNRKIFKKPVKYELDYQPLSTDGDIITAGVDYINRLIVYIDSKNAQNFHNADRCYVFTKPPKEYDKYCNGADYYIDGEPLIFLNQGYFYLQRMVGDSNE
jgi:hypothetical protein